MSLEAVLIQAAWLADAENGVNALAVLVPREAGDPAPTAVTLYDRATDSWVAREKIPRDGATATFPFVAVGRTMDGTVNPSAKATAPSTTARHLDGEIVTGIQWATRASDTAAAVREGSYVIRALRDSLWLLYREPAASRQRNGVQLVQLLEVATVWPAASDEDQTVTGWVIAKWSTRETTPF